MRRLSPPLAAALIACSLLQYPAILRADECVLYHKRASVEAVCGSVIGPNDRRLKDVEVTLTDAQGSVRFRTHSDAKGKFSFRSVSKGDYTLHAAADGYHEAQREIRVTRTDGLACHRRIGVRLGMSYCESATYIKGIDKPSDLDADFKRAK
jgi:carboxypeptidase family protein